jgi:hypothetical protein
MRKLALFAMLLCSGMMFGCTPSEEPPPEGEEAVEQPSPETETPEGETPAPEEPTPE